MIGCTTSVATAVYTATGFRALPLVKSAISKKNTTFRFYYLKLYTFLEFYCLIFFHISTTTFRYKIYEKFFILQHKIVFHFQFSMSESLLG